MDNMLFAVVGGFVGPRRQRRSAQGAFQATVEVLSVDGASREQETASAREREDDGNISPERVTVQVDSAKRTVSMRAGTQTDAQQYLNLSRNVDESAHSY